MNDAQKVTLERIKNKWTESACPYQVEENNIGDVVTVFIFPLRVPSLESNGTAIMISPDGKTEWVRREPMVQWTVENSKPKVCEVEGCYEEPHFAPFSEKLQRKVWLCEVHFKHALNQHFIPSTPPPLPSSE